MARRDSLDHDGFRARIGPLVKSAAAENVAWGCATARLRLPRPWAKSSGHRDNMLMQRHHPLRAGLGRRAITAGATGRWSWDDLVKAT